MSSNSSQPITGVEQESDRTFNFSRTFIIAALLFIATFFASQNRLFDTANKEQVAQLLVSTRDYFCGYGIRVPELPCASAPLIKDNLVRDSESLATQFSCLPDLGAVVEKLSWDHGSDIDATRLLSVLQASIIARSHQSNKNREASAAVVSLLRPLWKQSPQLVAAASCLYCSRDFAVMKSLIEFEPGSFESLLGLGLGHPRLLAEIDKNYSLETDFVTRVTQLHAEFVSPGDAGTAGFVGLALANNGDYERLKVWSSKGLNGGRALRSLDLSTLPLDLVISTWQQGVSIGYDTVELTEFLVSQGYRPALRWLVWLVGGELEYIRTWSFQREEGRYQSLFSSLTDFPLTDGPGFAKHYNQNWQQITWNQELEKWVSR